MRHRLLDLLVATALVAFLAFLSGRAGAATADSLPLEDCVVIVKPQPPAKQPSRARIVAKQAALRVAPLVSKPRVPKRRSIVAPPLAEWEVECEDAEPPAAMLPPAELPPEVETPVLPPEPPIDTTNWPPEEGGPGTPSGDAGGAASGAPVLLPPGGGGGFSSPPRLVLVPPPVAPIPEPKTWALVAAGLGAILFARRRV